MASFRVLTVRQPWAWAIITGRKAVENRTWSTRFRGRILVHAGASVWRGPEAGILGDVPIDMPRAAIVGSVEIYDCVPVTMVLGDRLASGPWCWLLRDPEIFARPVPWRGRLGLASIPAGRAVEVLSQSIHLASVVS